MGAVDESSGQSRERKTPFLVGEKLFLRPLAMVDAEGPYSGWFNDPYVCAGNSHHRFPYTTDAARSYIGGVDQNRTLLFLGIIRKTDCVHIGNIALDKINWVDRSAELAIIIGDRSCWGSGFGTEACRLICKHGFTSLNLHRIGCGTLENNLGMCKLARSLGMREEGRRRQAVYKNGTYHDVIEFGILRDEWGTAT